MALLKGEKRNKTEEEIDKKKEKKNDTKIVRKNGQNKKYVFKETMF